MNKLFLLKVIKENTDAERFYKRAKELGKNTAKNNIEKSQVSNLENIANSTFKVSDVVDYIKKQIARDERWRSGVGEELLDFINQHLLIKSEKIQKNIEAKYHEDISRREIQLQLVREFIHSFAVNYEYYRIKRVQK